MDLEQCYDALDFESIIRYADEEEQEWDAGEIGFMRGYLGEV